MWIILVWIIVVLYNLFLNKDEGGFDVMPMIGGLLSVIVGLVLTLIVK